MNDFLVPLLNLLPALWSRRWLALGVAWAIAIVGLSGALLFKDRYQASATMYVDTQSMLQPLLHGLSVQPDVGEQVHMLARTLLSRENLEAVIDDNHLLPAQASAQQRALLVQELGNGIKLEISSHDNIYKLSYIGHDPAKTLGIVRTLMALFVKQGLAGNERESAQALRFIDSQIALYDAKLKTAENRLRAFRSEHPGYSTPGASDVVAREGALQDQLLNLQGQLAAAQSSRSALEAQLAEVPQALAPQVAMGGGATAAAPSGLDERIAAEQARLDALLQRYTDAYPDVVQTRGTLARLEAQRARERSRRATGSVQQPQRYSQGTNPVYQQLRISLAQASANVASLQSQIADLRTRLEQLQQQQRRLPGLDEQYVELTRDYSVLNQSYQQLVQRRETAMLSRNQDASQRKDYFRIVDPPRLAPSPLFPQRKMLIVLVFLLALGAGVGTTIGWSLLLPAYHTARQLREASSRPVLGTVTLVATPGLAAHERRDRRLFITSSALFLVLFLAVILAVKLQFIH